MRLHLRPLGVGQYESFHPKLESQPAIRWNPESQQALRHREPSPSERPGATGLLGPARDRPRSAAQERVPLTVSLFGEAGVQLERKCSTRYGADDTVN